MADYGLKDFFRFTRDADIREVYLPVEQHNIPNYDPNWLRQVVNGPGTDANRLNALKEHEYINKAYLVLATLPEMGLQFLYYENDQGMPLTDFRELVFTHESSPSGKTFYKRLNEFDTDDIKGLRRLLGENKSNTGFGDDDIDPSLANIVDSGIFKITSLGKSTQQGSHYAGYMSAEKTFSYKEGVATLTYDLNMNPNGEIEDFSITLQVFSSRKHRETELTSMLNQQPPDLHLKVSVQRHDGASKYTPNIELTVRSNIAFKMSNGKDDRLNYTFDANGQYYQIGVQGTDIRYDRRQIERAEHQLATFAGFSRFDGERCFEVTDHPKYPIATMTYAGEQNLVVSSINAGQLHLDRDLILNSLNSLSALPNTRKGLEMDLASIDTFYGLASLLEDISVFEGATSPDYIINFPILLKNMANIQSFDARTVFRLPS